MSMTFSIN